MEKLKAHYPLVRVKERLTCVDDLNLTASAERDVRRMGLDKSVAYDVVKALKPSELHKSMTSHENHRIWQDVYHTKYGAIELYVKITKVEVEAEDHLVISFKEWGS